MKNYLSPSRRLLKLAARLAVTASLGLLACDRQPLEPQDSFAVSLEQAQQVAEHLSNTNVAPGAAKLTTVSGPSC